MKRLKNIFYDEKGAVLIVSLLVLAAITILGVSILIGSSTESKIAGNVKTKNQAFYIADAGIQRGIRQINDYVASTPFYYNNPQHLGTIFSNQSIGNGTYTVTIAADGTDSQGNNILKVTSTGSISSVNSSKQLAVRIIPQYTNNSPPFRYAAFGKDGITLEGHPMIDSYDSSKGAYGGSNGEQEGDYEGNYEGNDEGSNVGNNGDIGTNSTSSGAISLDNGRIKGDVSVGPNGNPSTAITGGTVTGTKSALLNSESYPDVTIPSGIGPGTALSISGNNTVNLSAGTYYYTSISISENGKLNINGAVVIYVSGAVSVAGNGIGNTTSKPTNFQLYVSGSSAVSINGNGSFYGGIYAPNSGVAIGGNGNVYGSIVGKTIGLNGNANFHYDEQMKNINGLEGSNSLSSYKVLSWKEAS